MQKTFNNKPSTAKTSKGLERARTLLNEAIDVFIACGFEGTSLSKIIEKSGGSRATIYASYGNKEGLFLAALNMMTEDLYRVCAGEYQHGRSLEDDLTTFGGTFLRSLLTNRSLGLLRLVYGEVTLRPKVGQWFYEKALCASYAAVAKILENHIDAPVESLIPHASRFVESLRGPLYQKALFVKDFCPTEAEIQAELDRCVGIEMIFLRRLYPLTSSSR